VVAKYDILRYLRSRRLLGIVVIEALMLILITAYLLTLGKKPSADDTVALYAGFIGTLILISATLFGGDAIVSEFQGRTGYLLFPQPVKRWAVLIGKFLASLIALFIVVAAYYFVALVAALAISGSFSVLGVGSMLLALLYSVSALAVAYLISSVMKGSTGALILTFAVFIFVFSVLAQLLGSLGGVKPWFVLSFTGDTTRYILQTPYPMDYVVTQSFGVKGTYTMHYFFPDVGVSIAVMLGYILVALLLSYIFFKRREMST